MEIIKAYCLICIIFYVIDMIAVLAICCIKPLRMRIWKWYCKLAQEFTEICLAFWPELKGENDEDC